MMRYSPCAIAHRRAMITGDTLTLAGLFLLAAALYSSVGHAGASGYLAAMALVGVAPGGMRITALALNVLVATIGTVSYMRAGHFDWRTFGGNQLAVATQPGGMLRWQGDGGRIERYGTS